METTGRLRLGAARWAVGAASLAVVLAWCGALHAQDLQYKLRSRVSAGEKPAVVLAPREALREVTLELVRSDGQRQTVTKKNVAAGREVELTFNQPEGSWSYTATLRFTSKAGVEGEAQFRFEAVVATAVKVSLIKPRSSVAEKVIVLVANAPVTRAEYEVLDDGGTVRERGDHDLDGVRAGDDLRITWRSAGAVGKINIKVYDPAGYWTSIQVVPFTVDIPHDEVEFDTGKSTFGPAEAKKLDATYGLIQDEIAKHGADLEIQLYIAGYTDTVGSAEGNLGLSEARARAIAAYFRRKGLSVPIYYQGFGEGVLAVGTADNVDEARNRRALYILGNQPPPTSDQLPRANWKRL